MSNPLAPGYNVRRPHPGEVEAVHALITASEIAEFGEAQGYSLAELRDEWDDLDLNSDAWIVVAPDDAIVGYAYIRDRRHIRLDVEGYVHPEHVGRGIGTTLVRLSEERAREHVPLAAPNARVVLHNWINARNADACKMLEHEGYTPARYFFQMEAELNETPPSPEWPENIHVRPFVLGEDEPIFYETMEEAMADHWGHVPISLEEWKKRQMGSTFDPSLWFLAVENGEAAGGVLCSVSEGTGWVDTLAVRAPWRRRGLGMALLNHAAGEFHRRGLNRMALGVDTASPTGATRLYERAGMHVAQQHATYGKELRSGEELAETEEVLAAQ